MDRRAPREFLFCLRRSARGRKQIADANSTRGPGVLRARPPAGGVGMVMVTRGQCGAREAQGRARKLSPPHPDGGRESSPRLPLVGPSAVPIPAAGSSSAALHQHIPLLSPLTSRPFLCAPRTPARFLPLRAISSPPRIPAGRGSRLSPSPPQPPALPPSAEGKGCGVWDKRTSFGEPEGFCARLDTAAQRSSPRSRHIIHERPRFLLNTPSLRSFHCRLLYPPSDAPSRDS